MFHCHQLISFIETVVSGIKEMYTEAGAPLQTVHFGGDEVPAGVWEKITGIFKPDETGYCTIKSTDDLWPYYYGRVNQILKSKQLISYSVGGSRHT
jgi:hexosaminidase